MLEDIWLISLMNETLFLFMKCVVFLVISYTSIVLGAYYKNVNDKFSNLRTNVKSS